MTGLPIWFWVTAAVLSFWALGAYNRLVRLRAGIKQCFASVEVHIRQRDVLLAQWLTDCVGTLGADAQSTQAHSVNALRGACVQVMAAGESGTPGFYLARTPSGACVYLGALGCTIYDRRPLLCRSFDCRTHYLILPRQDRDNLVRHGLSSRAVFNAGRARLKTLSPVEREDCRKQSEEFFS